MSTLLISDIHANLVALEAVLDAAPDVDTIWCLGDIIGYGPCPNECVQRIKELGAISLIGNHDLASLGELDLSTFNPLARRASEWTSKQLTDESRTYLSSLPPIRRINDQITIAHASPREPVWEYLLEPEAADHSFFYFDTQICCVGHTHVPIIFQSIDEQPCIRSIPRDGKILSFEKNSRYIINPGSVGQPRDGDSRAAYAIYDPKRARITFHRVAYDVAKTQQQMREVGLPDLLITRLDLGM
ncbi:MAG: metallophosphoesterase [Herpetosiphonaceae bacterium]|nr:MAG: metallophosphoesterase [Herpetosiphonaceae bacterium]